MARYEQILNKISPIFYKLAQYHYTVINNSFLVGEYYIKFASFLPYDDKFQKPLLEDIFYNYYTGWFELEKHIINELTGELEVRNILLISLFTKNNLKKNINFWYVDEFIVNMVINKFSFENGNPPDDTLTNKTCKDLFIYAVGKDTYDAIRNNIK